MADEDQVHWWKLGQPHLVLGEVSRINTHAHTHTHEHDSVRRNRAGKGEQKEGRSEPKRTGEDHDEMVIALCLVKLLQPHFHFKSTAIVDNYKKYVTLEIFTLYYP